VFLFKYLDLFYFVIYKYVYLYLFYICFFKKLQRPFPDQTEVGEGVVCEGVRVDWGGKGGEEEDASPGRNS